MHIGAQAGMVMEQWPGGQALLIPLPLEDGKSLQKASKVVNKVLLHYTVRPDTNAFHGAHGHSGQPLVEGASPRPPSPPMSVSGADCRQ